jgi:hypothetical protein
MTDQTGAIPPEYAAQAAQAVGSIQAGQAADAAESIEQIKQAAVRAALTEFEQQLAAQMAASQAQHTAAQDQIQALMAQLQRVRAQAGPPMVVLLGDAISQRLHSIAAAQPNFGGAHWAGVLSQADRLAEVAHGLAEGAEGVSFAQLGTLAAGVVKFLTRIHPRVSSAPLEGADVALDELERLEEAADDLAAQAPGSLAPAPAAAG